MPLTRYEPDNSRKIVDSLWLPKPVTHKEIESIAKKCILNKDKKKFWDLIRLASKN